MTKIQTASPDAAPLLEVQGLSVEFSTTRQGWVRVVRDASLSIEPGRARALVGESGSGKTVTSLSILGLLPKAQSRVAAGSIMFGGRDLTTLPERELRKIRGGEISMIFQEPMTSLNPAYTIGDQIAETVRQHRSSSRRQAWARAVEVLDLVGIPAAARRARDYPHSFSGGMRQRASIAMAIACNPRLLIADEPTTALDVTVQAAILELLRDLQGELGMAVLLVTHDLGVVADFCQDVTVMYAGEAVETGDVSAIFAQPRHPYTRGLIDSLPQQAGPGEELVSIPGVVPAPWEMPQGCAFGPRCAHFVPDVCDQEHPSLRMLSEGHQSRCLRWQELPSLTQTTLIENPSGATHAH